MISTGKTKYFGTDGIRGTYGDPHMSPGFVFRIGNALGHFLKEIDPGKPLNVVLGRDTRASGTALRNALICGLNQHAVYVHDGGIVPTPAVAYAVREQGADLGVVISASHNPASDNGVKLFDAQGTKLSPEQEAAIEAIVERETWVPDSLPAPKFYELDVAAFYVNYLRSLMDQHCLKKWSVVLDTANGATWQTSPSVFERWSAELHLMGNEPDRQLINDRVGSEYPEKLAQTVLEKGAQIGIAHDGDGDRLVVCDEKGQVVPGDVLLALFGMYAMRAGKLASNTLVATIHSNSGLDRALASVGAKIERVDVGDRNVAKRMREIGANIGGESSGHIIFSDWATTGDGLLAAAKLIELMSQTGKSLSELSGEVTLNPQRTKNLGVREKPQLESLQHLQLEKQSIEEQLGATGRVLIRYSGTEPKIRLLVEGPDVAMLDIALKRLERAAEMDLVLIDC